MPADSNAIDAAIVTLLANDAQLTGAAGYMPDGVFFDIAAKGKTRFVIVSLLTAPDTRMFQGRAFEEPLYLVKAVELSTSGTNAKAAAARIDTLLDGAVLTATGYGSVMVRREERVRFTEVDQDSDARWQHRGGRYQVTASPTS